MKLLLALWSVLGLLSTANAATAADSNRGAQLAATCAACHRLDNHAGGLPPIIGLDAGQLADRMQAFTQDTQSNHIMHTLSLTLSDDEIATVASYLANLGKAKAP